MTDSTREHGEFAHFNEHILIEEMLAGATPMKKAVKPDLTVRNSHDDVAYIEKKLLALDSLGEQYVTNGMARFADGRYGAGDDVGYILGYVHDTTLTDVVSSLDNYIVKCGGPDWASLTHMTTGSSGA